MFHGARKTGRPALISGYPVNILRIHVSKFDELYLELRTLSIMAGKGKSLGKLVATVRMYIPAGSASPSPPLGPALGQVYFIC